MGSHQTPNVLITAREIEVRVREMAAVLRMDYADKDPVLIGVLKGGFVFLADLVRALAMPVMLDFVRVCSYGPATESCGELCLVHDVTMPVAGRHVIVVDDILDTGLSLSFIIARMHEKEPASLRTCVLLDKPAGRRVPIEADYVGFTVPDEFVIGYGLDLNERYRELPDICRLKDEP